MNINLDKHLIGDVIIYVQLDSSKFFWPKEEREKFKKILKSIYQENIKIIAYAISKNSIHLIIYSQDTLYIQKFIEQFKNKIKNFLKSIHNIKRLFFRKNVICDPIMNKDQFFRYVKLIQEIPQIKKSRKKRYDQIITSYENELYLFEIPEIKRLYNIVMIDIKRFLNTIEKSSEIVVDNYNIRKGIKRYIVKENKSKKKILESSNEVKKLITYLILNRYYINHKEIAKELEITTQKLKKMLSYKLIYSSTEKILMGYEKCLNY